MGIILDIGQGLISEKVEEKINLFLNQREGQKILYETFKQFINSKEYSIEFNNEGCYIDKNEILNIPSCDIAPNLTIESLCQSINKNIKKA